MNNLIQYFTTMPDSHRVAILVISIIVFWNLENSINNKLNYSKWKHALLNTTFIFFDAPVQLIMGLAFSAVILWNSKSDFGIIHWIGIKNNLLLFVITFLILDFLEYVYHVVMHKFRPFWVFHLVHHSDQHLDVSTTLREHPGETLIRLSFTLLWVFIVGVPFWMLMARQFIQIISNVLAHANFSLNKKWDNILSLFFVTPNMHQVHHHFMLPYTDSNYGDVLSIWDRMFGTFRKLDAQKVVYGVDTEMRKSNTETLKGVVLMPYKIYKSKK